MMTMRTIVARAAFLGLLAFSLVACSAMQTKTLSPGMTPDQAVRAMGQPDLKDNVPDPNHSGASVLRFVWLDPGKAAIFGSDERIASISNVETNTKQHLEQQVQESGPPQVFDPINTPLNYLFFPVKAATIYFGAGVNCLGGGGCQTPTLPPPSAS